MEAALVMAATAVTETATVQTRRHRFTVDDYYCMAAAGILNEDDRVELIDGEIWDMSAIDAIHAGNVRRLSRILHRQIGDRFNISVQDPVRLNDYNEPEPDLAILRWRDDFYEQQHPTPGDVLVIIEVANTSLVYDRTEKLPRYAIARIPELWLVDVAHRTVEQYADPDNGQYKLYKVFSRGTTIQATTIADFALTVDQIFGL